MTNWANLRTKADEKNFRIVLTKNQLSIKYTI